jgi:acetoacetate decarboxylase
LFPALPARYRHAEFQIVSFVADPEAVGRLLPEPLEPSPDGACVAIGIRVPFSTPYGSYNDAVVETRCLLGGRPGWYINHVWIDAPSVIAAGREIYGVPMIYGEVSVERAGPAMLTRANVGGIQAVTISSTLDHVAEPEELPDLTPSWRLKVIPHADRPGPAIKQLVDGPAKFDMVVHAAYKGRGTVQFQPSPLSDLTALAPRAFTGSWYVECSYAEGFGRVELDYINDPAARARHLRQRLGAK